MSANDDSPKWAYNPEDSSGIEADSSNEPSLPPEKSVSWTASEFIDKHKGIGWYLAFFAGIFGISGLIFLITHDYFSPIFIAIAGVIFVILMQKKPQQLPYEINSKGLQIGSKFYSYTTFKSFGLAQEGAIRSINLVPLKRFIPEISIYFPPEQEMQILNILSLHLPHDQPAEKGIDKLIRKLRF